MRQRFVVPVLGRERIGEIVMRRHQVGLDRQRTLELGDGIIEPAAARQHVCQVAVGLGAGLELDHPLVAGDRLVIAPELCEHVAEIGVRIDIVALESWRRDTGPTASFRRPTDCSANARL